MDTAALRTAAGKTPKRTMTNHTFLYLASTYGTGSYNNSAYNGASTSSGLTDTVIAIASIVTIAAVILLVAMVVRIWKRPDKRNPVK